MSGPRLLLVEEPSAGVAPKIVEELFEVLADLNAGGLTILLVEQNVTFGLKLVRTAYLLRTGRVVYSGLAPELHPAPAVPALAIPPPLGAPLPNPPPPRPTPPPP